MKAGHDLDTAVTEGSLAAIWERYSIPAEYGLHVPRSGQRPYSSDAPGVGPVWGFMLDWSTHLIGNVPPYLSEESVLVGKLKGILSSSRAIKEMIELWLVEAGLSLASRGIRRKTLAAQSAASTQGVDGVPPTEAPKSSSKRPSDSPVPSDDPSRRHKKVKILSRRHKSRHGEGGSWSHSKGKEPAEPVEEPKTLVESTEEDASPVFRRPRSMKDLFKTKVHKDDVGYYALHMSDLAHQDPDKEMQPR
ncbi:hypothetical protein BHE74_00030205 [Ensete ventricosum]|nr:hypothetical protein BHE74_00030205 [Ensete ventricosum]